MVTNYLIGLREGLEAALVVGILIAYLVRSGRTDQLAKVWTGVGMAVGLSLLAGALLTYGPRRLSFEATETIGGVLSIITVALVTTMIFWMAKAARSMRANLEGAMSRAIAVGGSAVLVISFLAVGREGLETALFLWAGVNAAGATTAPLLGAALGIATACVLGWGIYKGAVALNLRAFFQWTGVVLIVIAGGVLAYGIHDLQEARILPGEHTLAFDVSGAVPPTSWYGVLLKGMFNFSPATTVLQAIAWTLYVVPTLALYVRVAFGSRPPPTTESAAPSAANIAVYH